MIPRRRLVAAALAVVALGGTLLVGHLTAGESCEEWRERRNAANLARLDPNLTDREFIDLTYALADITDARPEGC